MCKSTLTVRRLVSVALLAAASSMVHAEIYKWTNADGSTTYSNQPPTDTSEVWELTKVETPKPDARTVGLPPPEVTRPPAAETPAATAETDSPSRAAAIRSQLPQAVQDPCLTSWDRLCYQKNRNRYRPFVGYAPHNNELAENAPVVPPARGATAAVSGSGAVGGGSRGAASAR